MVGNVVHFDYWRRLVLYLDDLGTSRCVACIISELPSNGGVIRPNVDGRTAVPVISLSQLSFAFGAVIQCNAASSCR